MTSTAFSRMIRETFRRVGFAASILFVFCLCSAVPRTKVFDTAVAPLPGLSLLSPADVAGRLSFPFMVASAAPAAASSDTATTDKNRSERLLQYAEQRATNAEEELKRFRQTHESSVRACSEASQRKQRELEKCQEQSESFRQMYNTLQATKTTLEKEVLSLQSQLATATVQAASKGSPDAASAEAANLRAALTKMNDKMHDMEDQHAAEVFGLQKKLREVLLQQELLKQKSRGSGGDESSESEGERHIVSLSAIKTLLTDIGKVYRVLGEHMLTLVPATWWDRAAAVKLDIEVLTAPYTNAVYEKTVLPLSPYLDRGKTFFFTSVYPLCATVGRRAAGAAKTLSDDVLPTVNARLDAALEPIFAKHPDVEVLVPSGLGDRLAVFAFVLFLTYFVALISFRYVLCPVVRLFLPSGGICRKRRSSSNSKRGRTGGANAAGTQPKRFIPSGAAASGAAENSTSSYAHGGGGPGKKGQQTHHNAPRHFPFTQKYDGAPVNMKKV